MLAKYKRPKFYRFVESLPTTATGKKMHYKIKSQAIEDSRAGLLEKA
jgi:acyl-coenzyme A synthetase/AMP-(fatty) acid ligase